MRVVLQSKQKYCAAQPRWRNALPSHRTPTLPRFVDTAAPRLPMPRPRCATCRSSASPTPAVHWRPWATRICALPVTASWIRQAQPSIYLYVLQLVHGHRKGRCVAPSLHYAQIYAEKQEVRFISPPRQGLQDARFGAGGCGARSRIPPTNDFTHGDALLPRSKVAESMSSNRRSVPVEVGESSGTGTQGQGRSSASIQLRFQAEDSCVSLQVLWIGLRARARILARSRAHRSADTLP
ncbi:hypothetical protein K438DRAFT_1886076 [Mycena galopus ATCC 62051]|nr:hypothetical protein K438DRAFT_1886076 [Mycena galopus ATCC 62051]